MKRPRRKFEDSLPAARDAAVKLLARREHARRELGQKLAHRGYSADVVEETLDDLSQRDWLNETRYAAFIARHRSSQGRGPRWVRAELAAQGIEGSVCEQALGQPEIEWEAACWQALQRLPERDSTPRRKQKLYQRGFESEQIEQALRRQRESS